MSNSFLELGGFNPAEYNLPVDPRLVLSIDEMASVGNISADPLTGRLADGTIISLPEVYICACTDNNKIYTFNVHNEYKLPFGRFREALVEIVPNPSTEPTDTLTTVRISGITYKVSKLDELLTAGAVLPSEETYGDVGHLYIDQAIPNLYQCTQLDNSIIYADPGTELPINFGKAWKNLEVTGIEKILSNGGVPQYDTVGIKGQLYVDTHECDLYQCKGYEEHSKSYIWERVHKSTGFSLKLESMIAPYRVLYSDGTWAAPVAGQTEFRDVVAFLVDTHQGVEISSGMLSSRISNMHLNKPGYTFISDATITIVNNG